MGRRLRHFPAIVIAIHEPALDSVDNPLAVTVISGRRIRDLGQRGARDRSYHQARHQPAQSGFHAKPFLVRHGINMPPEINPTHANMSPWGGAPNFYSFR
ncbi:hypothetical protein ACI2L1_44195 [Streptomyces sp. NPDC019531]|uniref:hypothetical protein n=1 Tax=Streptomyces sp. NPDC019531 TaxID=3365062 RepID=UPI00384CF04D